MTAKYSVADVTHPYYDEKFRDWLKWRYTYEGGQRFIDQYLKQLSRREDTTMFKLRREISYNPAFAKQSINEVKDALFERMIDVVRVGGSDTYNDSVLGINGGVDLVGSSMPSFIGNKILPELLTMSRVGVFVDMPEISGASILDANGKRPYVYIYRAEDIRSWTLNESDNQNEFTNVLLRDYIFAYDDKTGLPMGSQSRFRRMWLEDGVVQVQFYNNVGIPTDIKGIQMPDSQVTLDIPRIPFIVCKLSDSLLADVANYQIALLNIASSDLAYVLHANFPFYTEQFDPRSDGGQNFIRTPGKDQGGEAGDAGEAKSQEVRVGISMGRKYPVQTERPAFIHPSSEPLNASMAKQEQLKAEIRQLVNLSLSNLQPQQQKSADSKAADQQGLESGLSSIGLELEGMERKIASFWAMYEDSDEGMVYYPATYSLKSDSARRVEAEEYLALLPSITSKTGQKALIKHAACLLLSRKVKPEELTKIMKEIDACKGTTSDSVAINADVLGGFLDKQLAAELRNYPEGTAAKADKEHADRLAVIAKMQTPNNGLVNGAARGVPDTGGKAASEKAPEPTDPNPVDKSRGPGK